MTFDSLTFIISFLLILVIYYSLSSWRYRKIILLVYSYLFYMAWNPPFVMLLWFSTIADWYISKKISLTSVILKKRLFLFLSLTINLGLLAFFKYGAFAITNFINVMNFLGFSYQPAMPDIILPIGISFYTFQTLSYTIDVYKKKINTCNSFLDYALYVTFFPQLVAGPIVRTTEFLPQCSKIKQFSLNNLGIGFSLIIIGLFQKVVIADGILAQIVEKVYAVNASLKTIDAWSGTLAFSSQIFCDFAGYSTIAIGVAKCLGFKLPINFHFPYASLGFSDFWRRWHISLSTWLKDYVYISLGGNRKGNIRTNINLLITMLLGGLWHGASWTFVLWGVLHGIYLVIEKLLRKYLSISKLLKKTYFKIIFIFITFIFVCFAWVLFRAPSFSIAFHILSAMFGYSSQVVTGILTSINIASSLLITASILLIHVIFRNSYLEEIIQTIPIWLLVFALTFMFYAILTIPTQNRAFIYFQF